MAPDDDASGEEDVNVLLKVTCSSIWTHMCVYALTGWQWKCWWGVTCRRLQSRSKCCARCRPRTASVRPTHGLKV